MKTMTWGNPYTHEEYSRTSYNAEDIKGMSTNECEWCGNTNAKGGLFEYERTGHYFCSKDCFKAYHS